MQRISAATLLVLAAAAMPAFAQSDREVVKHGSAEAKPGAAT
jgi:hypothetical protein